MSEVLADASHGTGAERLNPRRLQRIKDRTRLGVHGSGAGVELHVVMAKTQCNRIRRAARFGYKPGFEPRAR